MEQQPVKDVVDIGIVVRDADRSLAFYRDTLGLVEVGDVVVDSGRMWLLEWGRTMIKLLQHDQPVDAANPPGGLDGGTGYRWCTLWTRDIEVLVDRCTGAGYELAVPVTGRGERRFAMVVDPDGNWVELFDPGPATAAPPTPSRSAVR
jgi:glyoxylase I family protein